jgi:hypothetical protein
LLTTQREKVKVLAVLYDGGKHAEEVRSSPYFFPLSSFPPFWVACHPLACPPLGICPRQRRTVCRPHMRCYVWMRGTVERGCVTVRFPDCYNSKSGRGGSETSGKWGGCHSDTPKLSGLI